MKKRILYILRFAILAALCGPLHTSCSDEKTEQTVLETDEVSLTANKKGITASGGQLSLTVTSNRYWKLSVENGDRWVEATPEAGTGTTTVLLDISENEGAPRTATLVLETMDGTRQSVTLTQSGSDEVIYYVSVTGGSTPASMTALNEYRDWDHTGIGSSGTYLTGTGVLVDGGTPSVGYDGSSAGNNFLFGEDGSSLVIGPVGILSDKFFGISFGAYSDGPFSPSDLTLEIGRNLNSWALWNYDRSTDSGWDLATARFSTSNVSQVYLRLTGAAGVRVDDITLYGIEESEVDEVDFPAATDGNEVGYVFFEDDFSWVIPEFGGTDYIGEWPNAASELRLDLLTNPDHIAAWKASGWTAPRTHTYYRIGYIKAGRSADGSDAQSPKLSAITDEAKVNLRVTFYATTFLRTGGGKDNGGITVSAVNAGTVNGRTANAYPMQLCSWNDWETYSVVIFDATSETQINFCSTDLGSNSRWFLDNVKVVKLPDSYQMLPVLDTPTGAASTGKTSSSIDFTWDPVAGAAGYTYKVVTRQGVVAATDTITGTSVSVDGLSSGTLYMFRVQALSPDTGTTEHSLYTTSFDTTTN